MRCFFMKICRVWALGVCLTFGVNSSLHAQNDEVVDFVPVSPDKPSWYRVKPLTNWEQPYLSDVEVFTKDRSLSLPSKPEYGATAGLTV
ncbi:MAG: hypothetical protein LBG96_02785, partial [Tannerella sp.]|nr:hypothetical protein [Tannerella sp.]